jgi:hypothetical protein
MGNRVYWGDGEQLSHVKTGRIRLVQDARTRECVVGVDRSTEGLQQPVWPSGSFCPRDGECRGPRVSDLFAIQLVRVDTCPSRLRLDVGVVCREVDELLSGIVVQMDRQPQVFAENIVYLHT